jgi:hypothetical protein
LSIEVEGKKVDYSLETISDGNQVTVRLTNFKGEDKTYEAKLKITKGLTPQNGNKSTEERH